MLPLFRTYYFIHQSGAAFKFDGTFDESSRELSERELNNIKEANDRALELNKRTKDRRKHIPIIAIEPIKVFQDFDFANKRHYRSRKFRKAMRVAKRFGGTVTKYEAYVPQP